MAGDFPASEPDGENAPRREGFVEHVCEARRLHIDDAGPGLVGQAVAVAGAGIGWRHASVLKARALKHLPTRRDPKSGGLPARTSGCRSDSTNAHIPDRASPGSGRRLRSSGRNRSWRRETLPLVLGDIPGDCLPDGPEVRGTLDRAGRFARRREGGKENPDQQGDNANDHKQFYQGKPALSSAHWPRTRSRRARTDPPSIDERNTFIIRVLHNDCPQSFTRRQPVNSSRICATNSRFETDFNNKA